MPDRTNTIRRGLAVTLLLVGSSVLPAVEKKQLPPQGPFIDQDPAMLKPPEAIADSKVFTVADEPPRITFSTMTGLPVLPKENHGTWSSWGEGVVASNGKLYVGVGDHRGVDGNCYLYEYDPATHKHRQVLDMALLTGQKPGDYGHGKLHGRLDEMPDGWIYMATYWGVHPTSMPAEERNQIGGRFARYNVKTDTAEDLGVALFGDSITMHATDTRRGIFHGIGLMGGYFAYDIHARRPLYCGSLPGDVTWEQRCTLVDPKTGYCYGAEKVQSPRIVGYDPNRDAFFHTNMTVTRNPEPDKEIRHWFRTYTRRRLRDGSFICQSHDGIMFKFFPDEQRIERIGLNWVEGLYTASMALSPDDKYLYYCVDVHGNTWKSGAPVIQLNTETYAKKVIAFLHPYYQAKYGYVFGGSYSVCLDAKAEKLLIVWNGHFRTAEEKGESFGQPSFMCIEIPASERE